jgi:hypothetical protein
MYGVDECRVCGKPIRNPSPKAKAEQEKAYQKPLMPEKEWRRRGYLAPPTRHQLKEPQAGCCPECGREQARKFYNPNRRVILMYTLLFGMLAALLSLILGNEILGRYLVK